MIARAITGITVGVILTLLPTTENKVQNFNNSTTQPQKQVQVVAKANEPIQNQQEPSPQPVAVVVPETPKVEPTAAVQSTNCEDYRSEVSKYDWNVATALAVMRAESGCNPSATNSQNYNGSVDRGLFQVNSIHTAMVNGDLDSLYNVTTNIRISHGIYLSSGWSAWSAYNSGSYLRYL